jgi:hypothetical protein
VRGTVLIAFLVLALFGALPRWGHSRTWTYAPTGGVGLILLIVIISPASRPDLIFRHRSRRRRTSGIGKIMLTELDQLKLVTRVAVLARSPRP